MSGAPAPTPIGAVDAVAYSRQFRTWTPKGMCANHVASCYTKGLTLGSFGIVSAIDAWNKATQRETSTNPPFGAPVYWESGQWGHIAISVGGGRVRSTDYPVNEQLGECTLAEMGRRWPGMRYLGWSRDMAGRPIPGLEKHVSGNNPTPALEEDDMAMTPAERQALINDIANRVWSLPVPNHDPNPSDKVPPPSYAAKSYTIMANWRAAELQKQVGALRTELAGISAAMGALAKAQGADASQIAALVDKAVRDRLAQVRFDVTDNPTA